MSSNMQAELFILSVIICEVSAICSPKNATFINFPETPKRSKPVVIGVTAIKCAGITNLYYKWEVKEISGSVVQNDDAPSIAIDGYKYNTKHIFAKDFNVTVRLSHYQDMNASSSISKSFRFIPDKMHLEIAGGAQRTHPFKTPLVMDAESLSRDLSFPPNENAFEGNSIKWIIKPEMPGFKPPTSLRFTVPAQFLKLNQAHEFMLSVARYKIPNFVDTQWASQTVTFTDQSLPEINIACQGKCTNSNNEEVITVSVSCVQNCEDIQYERSTSPGFGPDKTDLAFAILPKAFNPAEHVNITMRRNSSLPTYSTVSTKKMAKGTCEIMPKEGISGVTLFKVQWKGFNSTNDGLLYMIYQKWGAIKPGVILSVQWSSTESYVYLSKGSPAEIVVRLRYEKNGVYVEAEVKLQAQVGPFSPRPNTSTVNAIKALILSTKSDSVVSLSRQGSRNRVVQMVAYLLEAIKDCKNVSESKVKYWHRLLAESLIRVRPREFESAEQLISILTKLEKFKLSTDTFTSRLLGKSILQAVVTVHDVTNHEEDHSIPELLINKFAQNVLALISNLLKRVPEIETELQQETLPNDYDSYDEMVSAKLKIRDDLRELTNNAVISLLMTGSSILHKNIPAGKAMILESELITFMTRRVNLTSLLSDGTISLLNVTQSKVTVSKPLVRELQKEYSSIDYQFVSFKGNPFWWHQNSSRINTEIVHFALLHRSYRIGSTENPFYVHLKTKSVPVEVFNGRINGKDTVTYRINMDPGFLLIVVFKPSSETYKVTYSDCYCNEEDFARGIEIRGGANESQRTLRVRPLKNKNIIYVCMKGLGKPSNYKGSLSAFSCVYWDYEEEKWNSRGCRIQEAHLQTGSLMECECTHASYFAGLILAPQLNINHNREWNFNLKRLKNRSILILLLSTLGIWSGFFAWACFIDKQMAKKNFVCTLDDNVPGDCHLYLVVVCTGIFLDAGTTADVAFQIIGDEANSRIHLIRCEGVTLLKRNAQDWFIINTPCYLGRLRKIRLWHNCKGRNPHWYCEKIIVKHLKSGVQHCFMAEKWFSLVWGDGRICREIAVTEKTDLNYAKRTFFVKIQKEFKDGHILFGIFFRDPQSNFNGKERVGVAMSIFYFSMLMHALLYEHPKNTPAASIDPKSSFYIDIQEVMVFVASFLIALPLGILLTLLFRNTAPEFRGFPLKRRKKRHL